MLLLHTLECSSRFYVQTTKMSKVKLKPLVLRDRPPEVAGSTCPDEGLWDGLGGNPVTFLRAGMEASKAQLSLALVGLGHGRPSEPQFLT